MAGDKKWKRINGEWISIETGEIYDKEGYDRFGYDREGYDRYGWNKEEINKETGEIYDKYGYDMYGYNSDGWNRFGYDKEGYNKIGYDKEGYNRDGYNIFGYNREGKISTLDEAYPDDIKPMFLDNKSSEKELEIGDNLISNPEEPDYQVTTKDLSVATKEKVGTRIIRKVKELFNKIRNHDNDIGGR